jgi:hypothetical protein
MHDTHYAVNTSKLVDVLRSRALRRSDGLEEFVIAGKLD